jgi:hypothetical protein
MRNAPALSAARKALEINAKLAGLAGGRATGAR